MNRGPVSSFGNLDILYSGSREGVISDQKDGASCFMEEQLEICLIHQAMVAARCTLTVPNHIQVIEGELFTILECWKN